MKLYGTLYPGKEATSPTIEVFGFHPKEKIIKININEDLLKSKNNFFDFL